MVFMGKIYISGHMISVNPVILILTKYLNTAQYEFMKYYCAVFVFRCLHRLSLLLWGDHISGPLAASPRVTMAGQSIAQHTIILLRVMTRYHCTTEEITKLSSARIQNAMWYR